MKSITSKSLALGAVLLLAASPLAAQMERPALEVTPVAPVKIETRGGVVFADFGKDAYGKLRLVLPADTAAGNLTIRLGEKLGADGAIDRHPPGSVKFMELALAVQAGAGTYEPPITSRKAPLKMPPEIGEVTPFRYAEIEGVTPALRAESLRQLFVHPAFRDDASVFHSSDPTLDAVWDLCKHTMKATAAFGVYIDGDRERTPYEADAYINFLSHLACDANPAVGRYTLEYLLQYPTWPTEWSFHTVMLAAADYEATGDPVLATKHYDALKAKLLMDHAREDGLLKAPAIVDWPSAERDGYNQDDRSDRRRLKGPARQMVGPEINTVVNAFYFHALEKMALLANAVNRPDEARELTAKAQRVAAAFNQVFFDPARGIYVDGEGSGHASLHANLFPLAFGLVPPEHRAKVADFVESRHMACSVYGAQYLLEALYGVRRSDAATRLLVSHDVRGWWHMLELGSTMTLEAWDARFKPNLTWNHAWGAAPANIVSRFVLGVRPLEPGYRKILIAPQPGGLASVSGKVPTVRGPVGVDLRTGRAVRLELDLPFGTISRVEMPVPEGIITPGTLMLDGVATPCRPEAGVVALDSLKAGHHVLQIGGN